MNILVTGGAGYIGSVVSSQLVEAGHHVVIYDNLSHGHRQALPYGTELVEGDIADRGKLQGLFREEKIAAVIHLAALIEAGESMKTPEIYFRNNTAGTLSLLEAMIASGVKRLVFSSTAALYGEPEQIPILESAPLKPTNVYGESKLLVEHMLTWFHHIHSLRYASLRYFNAAGATEILGEDHKPESHLIPLVLQVATGQREHISIFGTDYPTTDGSCVRDYIHVSDLAAAHLLALHALETQEKLIYNLGNGRGHTVKQVIEAARKITGHPIPSVESSRRSGDPAVLVASSEKIQRELGWKPKFPELDDIVRSAWEWRRKFPHGYMKK